MWPHTSYFVCATPRSGSSLLDEALKNTAKAIRKPVFSFLQLHFMVRELEAHDAAWQQYFAAHNICPYIVFYEILIEHYEETVLDIMYYLHVPAPEQVNFMPRLLRKQADAESEEWVQRYYSLKKHKGLHNIVASIMPLYVPRFRSSHFSAQPTR